MMSLGVCLLGLHHGDLRPSTFFVGASAAGGSRVKLLDLGTGERTATAVKDVRALVAILHRLLIGRPPLPLQARTPLKLNVTGVPPALEQSLGRWLATDGEGFTADEMATDLLEIRNASHGEFWSGAQSESQQRKASVTVQPRSSMIILSNDDDEA